MRGHRWTVHGGSMRGGPSFELIFGPHGTLLERTSQLEIAVAGEPAGDDSGSVFLTVTDDTGRVVGAARLIAGPIWQLASFVVRSSCDRIVSAALCHGVMQVLRVNRVRGFAISVDERAREQLEGVGLLAGSDSLVSVAGLLDRQRRVNPEGYRLV